MHTYELVICGHPLTVRSTADEAYVQSLARLVDERVRQASAQGAPPTGGALLAALSLADELMKSKGELARVTGQHQALRRQANTRADALLNLLDDLAPPQR
jgi:cell division protein ZapA (FtsZ GTPase activity inhibitor)